MPTTTDLSAVTTMDQLLEYAEEHAEPGPFAWASTGAGQRATVSRNRRAIDRLALVPRIMQDVSTIDTTTSLLGVPLSLPVVIAPVGATVLFHPDATTAVAAGATRAGTSAFCATLTRSPWEDVAATNPGHHFFQMYVLGDRGWVDEVSDRVAAAGFAAMCVTVDGAVHARRDSLTKVGFDWRVEREGLPENLTSLGRDDAFKATFTWDEFERMCSVSRLPVILKGVLNAEDARLAIEHGAAAVYVSNHGGRNVDHELSTIEALPEIAEAVDGRAPIIIDGGFSRGADICKAVALGADVVAVGRLQCWGLTLGGADGVAHMLSIIKQDLDVTMALLGCRTVGEITSDRVRQSFPPFG